MAKAKRMSDVFASSVEENPSTATATATPPYSSEGPTLPIIGGEVEHRVDINNNGAKTVLLQDKPDENVRKKRKTQGLCQETRTTKQTQPTATSHSALYEPWSLLPLGLTKPLNMTARLRGTENIVPIVFTKNQNVKAGINRLKTYLGAYTDKNHPTDVPEALRQTDAIIAVSAQGDGTTKLVSIVDVAKRVVTASVDGTEGAEYTDTWWTYTSLASVEVKKKSRAIPEQNSVVQSGQDSQEEEEAFEPMKVDTPKKQNDQEQNQTRKTPVLTIWMTKKRIPAFKEAFGEQMFTVQTLPQED
jgi:hypothetical protein